MLAVVGCAYIVGFHSVLASDRFLLLSILIPYLFLILWSLSLHLSPDSLKFWFSTWHCMPNTYFSNFTDILTCRGLGLTLHSKISFSSHIFVLKNCIHYCLNKFYYQQLLCMAMESNTLVHGAKRRERVLC